MPLRNPTRTQCVSRVMADIDDDVFNYFFKPGGPAVFTAARGPRQAMIAQFFEAVYEAAIDAGVPPRWEPDNDDRMQKILDNINFNPERKHHE